jgi:hypothetical protein
MGRKVTKTALVETIREVSGLALKDSRALVDELLATYEITMLDTGVPERPVMRGQLWLHRASKRRLRVTGDQTAPVKLTEAITSWETTHVFWADAEDQISFGVVTIDQWRSECAYIEHEAQSGEVDGFAALAVHAVHAGHADHTVTDQEDAAEADQVA